MRQLVSFVRNRQDVVLFLLSVLVVLFRLLFYDMISWDYKYHISRWYDTLKTEGFSAFSKAFSDYSPMYLYLIYFLTFIPLDSLYSIKLLSTIFDIILAFVSSRIVFRLTGDTFASKLSFVVVLSLPTVVMNSSYWAQSDMIYTTFVLLGVLNFVQKRYLWGYLSIGVAFSFKLQTVFILPAVGIITLYYLIYERKVRFLFYPLVIPVIYIVSIIPSYVAGRSLVELLTIYLSQTETYKDVTLSAPNIYTFIPSNFGREYSSIITIIGVILTSLITITLVVYFLINYKRIVQNNYENGLVMLFLLFALVEPYLLPRMHERYFYMADVLSVIFAFKFRDKWFLPVVVVLSSTLAYIQVNILLGLVMVAVPLGVAIVWYVLFVRRVLVLEYKMT